MPLAASSFAGLTHLGSGKVRELFAVDTAGGEPALLGDIVLCPEVAAKQAATAGHATIDELALLTVHGTLHLLGYDHAEPEEEQEMFGLQARLLSSWRK